MNNLKFHELRVFDAASLKNGSEENVNINALEAHRISSANSPWHIPPFMLEMNFERTGISGHFRGIAESIISCEKLGVDERAATEVEILNGSSTGCFKQIVSLQISNTDATGDCTLDIRLSCDGVSLPLRKIKLTLR